ncbi:universal stress protein [Haloarcula salina]|uniref:Universal stress protein n=1 Tax=Haloarcula salina TaxID=1429914 RepID=A0AA41G2C9_9EURY|nr:universal stress protein [Haloarcula salina]MBV0902189.1 universal stress protein [Haloarcula salina]
MYDAVLLPTDGSAGSELAADHAIDLAERHDAALHALYVLETSHAIDQLEDFEETSIFDRLEDAGTQAVEEIEARAADADITVVESSVERGVAHEEIVDYVAAEDIDVVVMATAGRTGTSRELIGSVTETVVRASPVPVLAVKTDE